MSGGKYHRIFEWNKFHDAPGTAIAFSPDGLLMVTGGSDGLLALFELSSGRALHLVQFPVQVQIICLFWSSVGEIFVGTSGHHLISLTWHREVRRSASFFQLLLTSNYVSNNIGLSFHNILYSIRFR